MADITEDEAFRDYPMVEESSGGPSVGGDSGEFVDAPAASGSWSKAPDQSDPLGDLNAKLASGMDVSAQMGTSGIGPVASGEEYAASHPITQEIGEGGGFGTVLRSAGETIFPYTNEIAAKAYAAKYPQLSEDQWYKVLTERENQYHQDSPVMSRVSDIGGAGAVLGGAGSAASSLLGMTPAVGATLAGMYGTVTAPGVPQMRMDEPGYSGEAATATLVGAAAPVVGPGIVTAAVAPFKASAKYIGKGVAKVMSVLAKDDEAAEIYSKWISNPSKYIDIKNYIFEGAIVY